MTNGAIRKVVVTWDLWKDRILTRARREGLGEVDFVITADRDVILQEVPTADAAFVAGWDVEMHRAATNVKWIHAVGGGVNGYLYPEMVDSAVPFTCGKPAFAIPGAEYALAAMLMFSRRNHFAVGSPPFSQRSDGRDEELLPVDLAGKTAGVLGMGGMGQALAPRAKALGMRVLGTTRRYREAPEGVDRMFKSAEAPEMVGMSDYVVVAVPLIDETEHLIDERLLRHLKSTAYIIDCSGRSPIFDYTALKAALDKRRLAGVCLQPGGPTPDMPADDSPFWKRPEVVVTPCRGTSTEQEEQCLALFFDNLRRFEAGRPLLGVVDKKAGY